MRIVLAAYSYDREPEFPIPRVVAPSRRGLRRFRESPAPVPRLDLVAIGLRKAGWPHALEARIELDASRVTRLGPGKRTGGEASVDMERRPSWPTGVPHDEALAGVHGGVDYKVAGSGHLGTVDLDIPVRDEAEISGILARTICVGQVVLDDDALRRKLEDNFALLRLMRLLGGRQYKSYRVYEKSLS